MDVTSLTATLITASPSAAVAIFFTILFVLGKLHSEKEFNRLLEENQALKRALEDERRAATEAAQAGNITNQLIGALVQITADKQLPARKPLDLEPGDLGL